MNKQPEIPLSAAGEPPADEPPVREIDIERLEALIEIDMAIARAEGRLALAQTEAEIQALSAGTGKGEPARSRKPERHDLRFSRVAKAAMEQEKRAAEALRERWRRHEGKVGAIVREVVQEVLGSVAGAGTMSRVHRWFGERDHDPALLDLPVGMLAARLCRDVGYGIEWRSWRNRPWGADALSEAPPEPEDQNEAAEPPVPTAAAAEPAEAVAAEAPAEAEPEAPPMPAEDSEPALTQEEADARELAELGPIHPGWEPILAKRRWDDPPITHISWQRMLRKPPPPHPAEAWLKGHSLYRGNVPLPRRADLAILPPSGPRPR